MVLNGDFHGVFHGVLIEFSQFSDLFKVVRILWEVGEHH